MQDEPHTAKLIARWRDCETNQAAAAAEGLRLFPDRHIQNQTLRLSGFMHFCEGTKHPNLFGMKCCCCC